MSKNQTATITKMNLDINFDRKYKLVMHNDDTTPFDIVIYVLMKELHKSQNEAISMATYAHDMGRVSVLNGQKDYLNAKREVCEIFVHQHGYTDFRLSVEEDN